MRDQSLGEGDDSDGEGYPGYHIQGRDWRERGRQAERGRAARMQIFAATEIETIRQLESSTRTGLCRFAPPARWRTGLAAVAAVAAAATRASLIQSAELSYES